MQHRWIRSLSNEISWYPRASLSRSYSDRINQPWNTDRILRPDPALSAPSRESHSWFNDSSYWGPLQTHLSSSLQLPDQLIHNRLVLSEIFFHDVRLDRLAIELPLPQKQYLERRALGMDCRALALLGDSLLDLAVISSCTQNLCKLRMNTSQKTRVSVPLDSNRKFAGQVTRLRKRFLNNEMFAVAMGPNFLDLARFLRFDLQTLKQKSPAQQLTRVQRANADSLEALVGAVYLLEGVQPALQLVTQHVLPAIESVLKEFAGVDEELDRTIEPIQAVRELAASKYDEFVNIK